MSCPGSCFSFPTSSATVALEQRPVPFERLPEASRDHELREAVHPYGELTLRLLSTWPSGHEAGKRLSPKQQRVAREQLIRLVVGEFVIPVRVRPAPTFESFGAAWILYDSVDGYVLRGDYSPHITPLRSCSPSR